MYPTTTCWGLATESLSNGKIVYDGILSESFNISMLTRKALEVACIAALSAHSLSKLISLKRIYQNFLQQSFYINLSF